MKGIIRKIRQHKVSEWNNLDEDHVITFSQIPEEGKSFVCSEESRGSWHTSIVMDVGHMPDFDLIVFKTKYSTYSLIFSEEPDINWDNVTGIECVKDLNGNYQFSYDIPNSDPDIVEEQYQFPIDSEVASYIDYLQKKVRSFEEGEEE